MSTATDSTAIYWDLDHLAMSAAADRGQGLLVQGSALARAIDHASVQRALGRAATMDCPLALALERAGVELVETCGSHRQASQSMDGFVHIAADDLALNPGIRSVVLVSPRGDVRQLANFVARAGRRFVQLRRAQVWMPAKNETVQEAPLA